MLRNSLLVMSLAALGSLAMLAGCSDDGGPKPVRSVSLAVDAAAVEICTTHQIGAVVVGGASKHIDWYVNGILGGQAGIGTITQTNPALFSAPQSIPNPATVIVKAVSTEDTTKTDSCLVTIQFTIIHVSASSGSDGTGTGCLTHPYKTIKRGLELATAGMTVMAAPGLYDVANGEVFPIAIEDSVSLVGENWMTTIIRGHEPSSGYRSTVSLTSMNPTLRRLTLEPGDSDSDVPIYVGATGAVVDSIRMTARGNYSNVRISTAVDATVSNCWFVIDDDEHQSRGFEIVFGDQGTIVRNCTVSGFYTGLFFNGRSDALVEGCILEDNSLGVETCCDFDPNHNPNPDLGGGARGSLGGNFIRDNLQHGFYHRGSEIISAKYNTWNNDPPTFGSEVGTDIYIVADGDVDWE
jgi:hypothetical protein